MIHLVNLSQFELTEEDIKNMIGLLDPKNKKDVKLIRKLLKLGNEIKRGEKG